MVGLQILDLPIGVRVPASQPTARFQSSPAQCAPSLVGIRRFDKDDALGRRLEVAKVEGKEGVNLGPSRAFAYQRIVRSASADTNRRKAVQEHCVSRSVQRYDRGMIDEVRLH